MPERWQDVQDVQDASIDMWTAVNVQHREMPPAHTEDVVHLRVYIGQLQNIWARVQRN